MKDLLKTLVLIASFLVVAQGSYGQDLKKLQTLTKVEIKRVTSSTQAEGMEMFGGKKIALDQVKKKFFKKKTITEVMSRDQIELYSGDIYYPEEVEFALVESTARHPHEKAPHNEKAPKDDN